MVLVSIPETQLQKNASPDLGIAGTLYSTSIPTRRRERVLPNWKGSTKQMAVLRLLSGHVHDSLPRLDIA